MLTVGGCSVPCQGLKTHIYGICGHPIPGGIQGQAGCGSGQPGLVVDDPGHGRGGWYWMITAVLFNPGHSMIL